MTQAEANRNFETSAMPADYIEEKALKISRSWTRLETWNSQSGSLNLRNRETLTELADMRIAAQAIVDEIDMWADVAINRLIGKGS